ncbi:MAG: ComF family protein [Candidatus Muiribacteriota bacterium]
MERTFICRSCACKTLRKSQELKNLKAKYSNVDKIYYLGSYRGVLKANIWKLKFKLSKNKMKQFAFACKNSFKLENRHYDYILYVPSFKKKAIHSHDLAVYLGKIISVKVLRGFLKKNRETEAQKKLSRNSRKKNLKDVFEINNKVKIKKNSKILLFDDIITTGTTINEILKRLKIYKIDLLFLAIADKKNEEKQSKTK